MTRSSISYVWRRPTQLSCVAILTILAVLGCQEPKSPPPKSAPNERTTVSNTHKTPATDSDKRTPSGKRDKKPKDGVRTGETTVRTGTPMAQKPKPAPAKVQPEMRRPGNVPPPPIRSPKTSSVDGRGLGGSKKQLGNGLLRLNAKIPRSRLRVRRNVDDAPVEDAKKKEGKTTKKQVWKRSEAGTLLSKVSVGDKKYLELRKMRVTVQVDGIRARTVIDHIYYNPFDRQLEGTFKYTLPANASISYYAMFVGQARRQAPRFFTGKGPDARRLVAMKPSELSQLAPKSDWGTLREARLVSATKGREVYENVTRQRLDPALVEQEAPNTFSARVFPVPAKGYNRVIIAYEETLSEIGEERVYSFRFPPSVAKWIDFSIEHNPTLATLTRNNLRKLRCNVKEAGTLRRCFWEANKPDRNAVFYFKPSRRDAAWLAGTDPLANKKYLLSQLRVELPNADQTSGSPRAVFLLDTSLSENPDRFAASVALLKKVLEQNESIKAFNVLFFDVTPTWANAKGWLRNDPVTRKKLYAQIDSIVLEGATNFGAVMKALAKPDWLASRKMPDVDVFLLSDGQLNWGSQNLDAIVGEFKRTSQWGQTRFFAYHFGLGSENLSLFRRVTRLGGAVFSCLGESELEKCATAHTKPSMTLEQVKIAGIGAREILVSGRQVNVFPGSLLTVAARYEQDGVASVELVGRYLGKPHTVRFSLPVKARGDLAPRGWAEIAVAQLIELGDPKLEKLVVAYSQHFQLANKYCSFLVLETDKEYKQYGLDEQRTAQKVEDVAGFVESTLQKRQKPISEREILTLALRRGAKRMGLLQRPSGRALLALLAELPEASFEMPTMTSPGLITKTTVPADYQNKRGKDRNDFEPFVVEAQRRLTSKQVGGAVRAISCLVELHPGDPRALRLVGYYLLAWNRPSEAASIFMRVLERRPYEPHSYRDLARALIKMKRYGLAAALYEVVIGGQWRRFNQINVVAREEYALMLQQALKANNGMAKALGVDASTAGRILRRLKDRKSLLGLTVDRSKLRVTVTWNTDNTDIDLWVEEPGGQRCWYRQKRTQSGGVLLQDVTWGYGPERYENKSGPKGRYAIKLQFYGHRSNVLGNETHAHVTIIVNA
ncbi:MAG: hypothetical protein KC609_06565, partial [Myxococcales bacterium]|nr:hypothetical protein [Myxococcales bacterium]